MDPIGSSPPQFGTGPERISRPIRLATTRVEPNTVDSEIGPRTKKGSTLAVPNSNDASHSNAISPSSSRHGEMKSKVIPNPIDTLSPGSTGSRRTRKKKPRASPVSLLTHSSRTNAEGTLPSPTIRSRANSPSRKPTAIGRRLPTVNEAVADFNRARMMMGLEVDISAQSELETSSAGIVSSSTSPLPTVKKHEATVTNDDTKTPDPIMPTRPSGKFASKRPDLVSHLGNRLGSMKREANLRVMKLGRLVAKNFSPTNSTVRLPSSPTEVMANSPAANSTLVITPRDDPPESHSSVDDAPDYHESRTLLHDWEKKTSEELSSESQSTSQSFGIEINSQPSPENRNDIISCDIPGSVMSVTEPDAIARRMLQSKLKHMPQSPPPFSDVSDISPISPDEGFKPPDPQGDSPVLNRPEHSSPEVSPRSQWRTTLQLVETQLADPSSESNLGPGIIFLNTKYMHHFDRSKRHQAPSE